MIQIKSLLIINRKKLLKFGVILILIFMLEYLIWTKLNFHHKSNEIAIGNFIASLVIIASLISIIFLVNKKHYKWPLILIIHCIGLFVIDRITLKNGFIRFYESKKEAWEFHHNGNNYLIERDKQLKSYAIYLESIEYKDSETFDLYIAGSYSKIENGWELTNDSLDIKILGQRLIGFPNKYDTLEMTKTYF